MKFGIYLPTVNGFADPEAMTEVAVAAEESGWDGVFLWDHIAWDTGEGRARVLDTWVTLGAIASRTSGIRIGPLVTPVARRRPQKLAREAATLDRLSGGRLTLGVGLGMPAEMEFTNFGEEGEARPRAQRLDEGLGLLEQLWSGVEVDFDGEFHRASTSGFLPTPVQEPRIPIWVAGSAKRRPVERAARWDGMFPMPADWPGKGYGPEDYAAIRERVEGLREGPPRRFDLVHATTVDSLPTASAAADLEAAGVTWWLASLFVENSLDDAFALARRSPESAANPL